MDATQIRSKLIGSDDERAVSPVIGVILMVAITVILAAVIAAFVLDMGDLDDSAPNAQFEWEGEGSTYTVTLTSGENIDPSDLTIQGSGTAASGWPSSGSEITAGDSLDISPNNNGDKVTIVWESDGSSTILTEYEP